MRALTMIRRTTAAFSVAASSNSKRVTLVAFGHFLRCICVIWMLVTRVTAGDVEQDWARLPSLPDRDGFAGSFAGVLDGSLIVAGGANFPDKKPWEGGQKVWHDSVFALDSPDGKWVLAGRLPHPMGYGVSFTTPEGIVIAGGSHQQGHSKRVWRMTRIAGKLRFDSLPDLPEPCAMMCGVQRHHHLYIMGGIVAPDSTTARQSLWILDLTDVASGWQVGPPFPGAGRILATTAVTENAICLFSGASLQASSAGTPERVWLKDAYRYSPSEGWSRLADLPRVAVAAPSPAINLSNDRIQILGGDDGTLLACPPEDHPGFPRTTLIYDVSSNHWTTGPALPFSLVTTTTVRWHGREIVPGGEERPGIRSTEVWSCINR